MMRIPYIRITQKGEVFYVTKIKADVLSEHLNFHFREPYADLERNEIVLKNKNYIESITKKGIELTSNEEGIQRRLQLDRINNIKSYIESSELNFLPNSVLLSLDVSHIKNFEEKYLDYESEEIGYFDLPDKFFFSIIDGQHRLAGLSLVDENILKEFDIVAIILINVSKPNAAKLFADINGKQKAVNKSLIYDLYSEIGDSEFKKINRYHTICENFYKLEESPLYRQIKMLGIGSGAISQAFFIDYVSEAINKTSLQKEEDQSIFNHLFYYFKAYQETFPKDWPVPLKFKSVSELYVHADYVLKERKSQLVKTNGFGAILRAFPFIYTKVKGNYKIYLEIVSKLKNKISWLPTDVTGTGKAFQNSIYKKIVENID